MSDEHASMATKLDLLFEYITHPDGKRLTYDDVTRLGGVDRASISRMRTGKKLEPAFQTMVGFATAFGVPLSYFATPMDEEEVRDFLTAYASDHDESVLTRLEKQEQTKAEREAQAIAMRAAQLDDEGRQAVAAMIDYVLKSQGINLTLEEEA